QGSDGAAAERLGSPRWVPTLIAAQARFRDEEGRKAREGRQWTPTQHPSLAIFELSFDRVGLLELKLWIVLQEAGELGPRQARDDALHDRLGVVDVPREETEPDAVALAPNSHFDAGSGFDAAREHGDGAFLHPVGANPEIAFPVEVVARLQAACP